MPSSVKRVRAGGNWGRVVGIVYSVRRRPRSPWSAVWSRVTAAMWLDVFREVTVAQRARRLARLAPGDHARQQRMLLAFERCVPHLVPTVPEPWDAGPDWGVVSAVSMTAWSSGRGRLGNGALGVPRTSGSRYEIGRVTTGSPQLVLLSPKPGLVASKPRHATDQAWVERCKSHMSPTVATALVGAPSLRHYPARQKMLKPYPDFEELPLAT